MANHDRRGCAGDAGHAVMLGQPVPAVAPCFSVPGEIQGITQRLRRIAAGSYGRESRTENGIMCLHRPRGCF